MQALISTTEPVQTGYRVAQVVQDSDVFPVADTLFWVECDDATVQDAFWYDPKDKSIKLVPQPELQVLVQPTVGGAQTL